MRIGITSKLFAAILLTCLVVTFAMGFAVRYSFERGFQDYVQEREERRATDISMNLGLLYRERGGWDALREDPQIWIRILRASSRYAADRERDRLEWERELKLKERESRRRWRDKPPGFEPIPPPSPPPPPPYSVLDANQQVVAGPPVAGREGENRRPVEMDGETIGWLVQLPPARAPDDSDNRFQARQENATSVIVGLSALLAAIVSILLARIFLAPVRSLAGATQRLAAGDYTTRVQPGANDELGQLAEDFNRLANTLEKNEQLRRSMVADISHELRTPLAVLRGEIEALEDGVRPLTPDTLASLQAEVLMLNKLIDDLHELSLADEGALTYRMADVDLEALIVSATHLFRERLRAKRLELSLELTPRTPEVRGDPQRLRQLLTNLLENALRYTDPGGVVTVRLGAEHGRVRLDILDSAPGVPDDALPRLFERLYRVDASRSRESGGSGLGLTICQRIAEAHGATIEAHPSPLGGVWIAVIFPPN